MSNVNDQAQSSELELKEFTIPVGWHMANEVKVMAATLEDAIKQVEDQDWLPMEGAEYVDDSFSVNVEVARELIENQQSNSDE